MASLWEPPALLTLAVLFAGGAGVLYHALRPALRGPLPHVVDERDEVWGVEDPPPPPKKRYVYPADRPVPSAAPIVDREPEPLALMPAGPTVAPVAPVAVTAPASAQSEAARRSEEPDDTSEDEDEELSLADLFRPKRRSQAAPNDAPTQD